MQTSTKLIGEHHFKNWLPRHSIISVVLLAAALTRFAAAATFYPGVSPTNVFWPGGIIPYEFDTNYPTTPA